MLANDTSHTTSTEHHYAQKSSLSATIQEAGVNHACSALVIIPPASRMSNLVKERNGIQRSGCVARDSTRACRGKTSHTHTPASPELPAASPLPAQPPRRLCRPRVQRARSPQPLAR
eukprot:1140975-Pelagomonas_calceolata.AAC.2